MTLYRQMALLISAMLLLILASVMTQNFINANKAVQEGLYEDAKNTASSLSLSLGTANGDTGIMETMINANFDSGHYVRIALDNLDGVQIYERIAEQSHPDVPQWFLDRISIDAPVASAQVSAGWNPLGTLHVQSDPAVAYEQLYTMFHDLLISFGTIALVSLIVLNYLLHVVLRPLKKVQNQAESILKNQFILQEKLPLTTEFRDVVKGMNAMVGRVQEIFEKGNEAMARNQELMYNDPITKLFNRRYLMLKLPDLLEHANEAGGGMMLLVSLEGADIVNRELGRQKADDFFKALGETFLNLSARFDNNIVSRINGTEFALLLPNCTPDEGAKTAKAMNDALKTLKSRYELETDNIAINIGLYRYMAGQDIPTVMTKADYALAHAKALEHDNTYLFDIQDDKNAMGKEQWRGILEWALQHNAFKLAFWPVVNTQSLNTIHSVMTFSIHDEQNTYSYGSFAPQAISLGLLPNMYLHSLETLFMHPPQHTDGGYSIRLSSDFLKAPHSYEKLKKLLQHYRQQITFELIFEISDTIMLHHLELILQFDALFDSFGYKIGINQFTGESKNYHYLQEIRPSFIKADAIFLLDQTRESMQAIQLMTDSLGIELIATGVREHEHLDQLRDLGITTIQGPLAESLQRQ